MRVPSTSRTTSIRVHTATAHSHDLSPLQISASRACMHDPQTLFVFPSFLFCMPLHSSPFPFLFPFHPTVLNIDCEIEGGKKEKEKEKNITGMVVGEMEGMEGGPNPYLEEGDERGLFPFQSLAEEMEKQEQTPKSGIREAQTFMRGNIFLSWKFFPLFRPIPNPTNPLSTGRPSLPPLAFSFLIFPASRSANRGPYVDSLPKRKGKERGEAKAEPSSPFWNLCRRRIYEEKSWLEEGRGRRHQSISGRGKGAVLPSSHALTHSSLLFSSPPGCKRERRRRTHFSFLTLYSSPSSLSTASSHGMQEGRQAGSLASHCLRFSSFLRPDR